jgi:hypothetical protein
LRRSERVVSIHWRHELKIRADVGHASHAKLGASESGQNRNKIVTAVDGGEDGLSGGGSSRFPSPALSECRLEFSGEIILAEDGMKRMV